MARIFKKSVKNRSKNKAFIIPHMHLLYNANPVVTFSVAFFTCSKAEDNAVGAGIFDYI